jgi:hypothetical protein
MRGNGRDDCPVCGQRGTVTTDDDGYVLVEHAGRTFPCRPRPATPGEWLRVQAAVLVASARSEAS